MSAASEDRRGQTLRRGVWRRAGSDGFVFIVRQSWDFYHDEYTEGEPDLGPDGYAYYALFASQDDVNQSQSRSPTCLTESEAVERAERLSGPITWL